MFFGSSPSNIGHDGIYIGGGSLIDSVQGFGVEIYTVNGYGDYQGASRPAPLTQRVGMAAGPTKPNIQVVVSGRLTIHGLVR